MHSALAKWIKISYLLKSNLAVEDEMSQTHVKLAVLHVEDSFQGHARHGAFQKLEVERKELRGELVLAVLPFALGLQPELRRRVHYKGYIISERRWGVLIIENVLVAQQMCL